MKARDVASAPQGERIRFYCARAERLPFADESFDVVFARDVLMYAGPEAVARESCRVLVPDGRAVFIEALAGNPAWDVFRRLTSNREYRSFTRHLHWREMTTFGRPLELVTVRAHHLLSVSAFWFLFVLRSVALYRLALALFRPVDRLILDRFAQIVHSSALISP